MRCVRFLAVLVALLLALTLFAAPALAMTCDFDTDWGLMRLNWNQATGAVSGTYQHKGGNLQGQRYNDGTVRGIWRQNDGSGNFFFQMTNTGFHGSWNYAGDSNWRGAWNGRIRGCY